jgi:predicted DNA-binding transcriptional regulator AlpA
MTDDVKPHAEIEAPGAIPPATGRLSTALAVLPEKALLDEAALATALDLSKRTIRRMVSRRELPPPFRFAGKSTWFAGKVLAHVERRADKLAAECARAAGNLKH